MSDEQDILPALQHIALMAGLNHDCKLLTGEQVAALLEVGYTIFREKIATSPGFPAPISVTGTAYGKRWRPSDIRRWIDAGGYQAQPSPGRKRKAA